jgi:hypothetical protein
MAGILYSEAHPLIEAPYQGMSARRADETDHLQPENRKTPSVVGSSAFGIQVTPCAGIRSAVVVCVSAPSWPLRSELLWGSMLMSSKPPLAALSDDHHMQGVNPSATVSVRLKSCHGQGGFMTSQSLMLMFYCSLLRELLTPLDFLSS